MKILFVTAADFSDDTLGGVKCSLRNHNILLCYGDVDTYVVRRRSAIKSMISIAQGYYPPCLNEDYRNILNMIKNAKYDFIFFDGSDLGKLIKRIKKEEIKTMVFYHNCEHDYISVRFGNRFSLKKWIYGVAVNHNERLSSVCADYRIVMSERDRRRIETLYSVIPEGIFPLAIEDRYQKRTKQCMNQGCLLFGPVGTANIEAFSWFVEQVSPYLDCKTIVAGRGFEKYKEAWGTEKVSVIGSIEDIAQMYADVTCVAIPLLSGAGMKIKTAEAMMFGKYIFGTNEAFVGFNLDYAKVGGLCNSAEEFIDNINTFLKTNHEEFNNYTRKQYELNCSMESSKIEMRKMIEDFIDLEN